MAPMGDPNASIPTPQPVHYRPMCGALGGAPPRHQRDLRVARRARGGRRRALEAGASGWRRCADTRGVRKRDLIHNDALPVMEVDAQTYEVRADGVLLTCAPAAVLPLAQRYFLF